MKVWKVDSICRNDKNLHDELTNRTEEGWKLFQILPEPTDQDRLQWITVIWYKEDK